MDGNILGGITSFGGNCWKMHFYEITPALITSKDLFPISSSWGSNQAIFHKKKAMSKENFTFHLLHFRKFLP
jgi:hypothetical protein